MKCLLPARIIEVEWIGGISSHRDLLVFGNLALGITNMNIYYDVI